MDKVNESVNFFFTVNGNDDKIFLKKCITNWFPAGNQFNLKFTCQLPQDIKKWFSWRRHKNTNCFSKLLESFVHETFNRNILKVSNVLRFTGIGKHHHAVEKEVLKTLYYINTFQLLLHFIVKYPASPSFVSFLAR